MHEGIALLVAHQLHELLLRQREFFIDNLLVRIHFIIERIWRTGLAPWEFEFPFPGSLTPTCIDSCSSFGLGFRPTTPYFKNDDDDPGGPSRPARVELCMQRESGECLGES